MKLRDLSKDEAELVLRIIIWAFIIVACLTWLPPILEEILALLKAWTHNSTDPLAGVR